MGSWHVDVPKPMYHGGSVGQENNSLLRVRPEPLWSNGFRAFKRKAQCTIPEELGQRSNTSRNTEKHCVVIMLREVVVAEQHTRVCINIRPRVLHLTKLRQHSRDNLEFATLRERKPRGSKYGVTQGSSCSIETWHLVAHHQKVLSRGMKNLTHLVDS